MASCYNALCVSSELTADLRHLGSSPRVCTAWALLSMGPVMTPKFALLQGTSLVVLMSVMQVACSRAIADPASDAWDAGLQGSGWQRRQQAELVMRTAADDAERQPDQLSARSRAGALLPCSIPPYTAPLPDGPLPAELQALIKDVTQELETMFVSSAATGGSATIVYGDRVLLSYGFGTTTAGGTSKCNGDTVFRVGSISKVFTDLLLYRFAEEGSVSVTTSVSELAPNYSPAWPRGKTATPQGTTLRDLGSHMAGL